jgi:hypothetical protein
MGIRRSIGASVVLFTLACNGASPTQRSLAPPAFSPTAKFAVADAGGVPDLKVSVTLYNRTAVHLQAVESSSCPFAVGIAPYPGTATYTGVFGCAAGGAQLDVVPGDSAVLTGLIGADTLRTFAPGTYQVNILVGTNSGGMSLWAGTIQLPLTPLPPVD